MSPEERRAWIARRDPERVKANDRARYERDKPKRRAAMDEYHRTHKERLNDIKAAWSERNPEKKRAAVAVNNALRDGRLTRQPCEVCGARAQGHHDDYSKPLEVRWLCSTHHAAHHAALRELERAA